MQTSVSAATQPAADGPDEIELKDLDLGLNEDENEEEIQPDIENGVSAALTEVEMEARLNKEFMLTPCGHPYHSVCLKKWIDIRRECPTCRAVIPLPEDHDEI